MMGRSSNDDAAPEETTTSETQDDRAERPRGLWAMMGAVPASTEAAASETDEEPSDSELLEEAQGDYSDLVDSENQEIEQDEDFELADDDEEDCWEVESSLHDFDAAERSLSSEESVCDTESRSGLPPGTASVALGILSILLAGLNLLPSFAAKFPATFAGGYALLLGYQTLGSNRRLRNPVPQILAPVGMFLGLVGIFAGPAWLNELGESWRNRSTREVIESNLGSISKALNEYAIEKGSYPAGGTFTVNDEGLEVGMHGWMTSLLPYLGYTEIYASIELSKPWNYDANSAAMSRPIPTFLIPSVPHEPTGRGLATAHYSGIGGLIQTEQGLLPTGIFNKNASVRIEEVSDGMSQTLIAGEIARALPAWGDPENWRTIEGPLNKRLSSFGNAAGTGAHFLLGDGSVRFFSNKTSPDVLQKLATRNAGD